MSLTNKQLTLKSFLVFTFPTMIMMIFLSLYTIIDGVFVSRVVGQNALSAINIFLPLWVALNGIAVMFATGGSAIVAKNFGEGKPEQAKQHFSLIVAVTLAIGLFLMLLQLLFLPKLLRLLGATDNIYEHAYAYGTILTIFMPTTMLKSLFDYFMVTANQPKRGLFYTVIGGVTNIILDYLFIVVFKIGIAGAALATAIGLLVPAILGFIYFMNQTNYLHFTKPKLEWSIILKSMGNGSSEMVTNLSSSVTTLLFNLAMLHYLGEKGVAAITIVLYAQFFLMSAYLGFSSGAAPLISFNYGENNHENLRKLIRYSYRILMVASVATFALALILASPLIKLFTGGKNELYHLTLIGFNLFAISFLPVGLNIFTSAMFTAFSNGKISAFISILRTLILVLVGIILLPTFLGVYGVWLTIPFSEAVTPIFSLLLMKRYGNYYHYA